MQPSHVARGTTNEISGAKEHSTFVSAAPVLHCLCSRCMQHSVGWSHHRYHIGRGLAVSCGQKGLEELEKLAEADSSALAMQPVLLHLQVTTTKAVLQHQNRC